MTRVTLFLILLVKCFAGHAQDVRPIILDNVVSISSKWPEHGDLGYGLIVARSADVLWVVTAAHVVFKSDTDKDSLPAPTITASALGQRAPWTLAAPPIWAGNDIAFVPFLAPSAAIGWITALLASDPVEGEAVSLIGTTKGAIAIQDMQGRIGALNQTPAERFRHRILDLQGEKRQSGAPVVTPRGIVGIYLGLGPDGRADPQVVSISYVQARAQELRVPWELIANDTPPPNPVRVCVRQSGNEKAQLALNGLDITRLDDSGCGLARAGQIRLVSETKYVVCRPDEFRLAFQTTPIVLDVQCFVDPTGWWRSERDGGVHLERLGADSWGFRGLDFGKYGLVEGKVSGTPPGLIFAGMTAKGFSADGTATVQKTKMSVELFVSGKGSYKVILERQ